MILKEKNWSDSAKNSPGIGLLFSGPAIDLQSFVQIEIHAKCVPNSLHTIWQVLTLIGLNSQILYLGHAATMSVDACCV